MANFIDIAVRARDTTAAAFKKATSRARKFGKTVSAGMKRAAASAKRAALGILAVGAAVVAVAVKAVAANKAQAQSEAKLEAILKATGYTAGFTTGELKKQAAALQELTGIGDEVIISTQGMLASFKQIRGDEFNRATMAVLDMGAAMKKAGKDSSDIESSAIQVGKALNDPIKGLSALSRVGVTFTEQQKEQIRTMQEAGDVASAQAIILAELESEFGGVAEAMTEAANGTEQLKQTFGDTMEAIGKVIVESELVDGVIKRITASLKSLNESGYIELWADRVNHVLSGLTPVISGIAKAFGQVKKGIQQAAGFVGALSAGADLEMALDVATDTPDLVKKGDEEKIKAIKAEKAAVAAAKDAEEKAEMAVAAAKRKVTEASEAKVAAIKKEAAAAKEAAKAAAKLEGIRVRLADMRFQDEAGIFAKNVEAGEKNIEELQEKLAGVASNKEERRAQESIKKQEKRDQRREDDLRERLGHRGTTLSKDSQAFLKERELARKIEAARVQLEIDKKNAEDRRVKLAEDQRKRMVVSLEKQEALLDANLKAG